MTFKTYGDPVMPSLFLLPGLGVSYEIFLPLIHVLEDRFYIVAAGIDGFLLEQESQFTSVDDQVRHLRGLHPETHVQMFPGMNHGQLLIDYPDHVAARILNLLK